VLKSRPNLNQTAQGETLTQSGHPGSATPRGKGDNELESALLCYLAAQTEPIFSPHLLDWAITPVLKPASPKSNFLRFTNRFSGGYRVTRCAQNVAQPSF
jgi:hypothetical protein